MPCSAAWRLAAGRPRDRRDHAGGAGGRDQRARQAGPVPAPAQAAVMARDRAGPRRAGGTAVIAAVPARQRRGPPVRAPGTRPAAGLAGTAARLDVARPLAGQRRRGRGPGLDGPGHRRQAAPCRQACPQRPADGDAADAHRPGAAPRLRLAAALPSQRPARRGSRPDRPGRVRPAPGSFRRDRPAQPPGPEGSTQPDRLDPARQGRTGPRHHHRRLRSSSATRCKSTSARGPTTGPCSTRCWPRPACCPTARRRPCGPPG